MWLQHQHEKELNEQDEQSLNQEETQDDENQAELEQVENASTKCKAETKSGSQCKNERLDNSEYCSIHQEVGE